MNVVTALKAIVFYGLLLIPVAHADSVGLPSVTAKPPFYQTASHVKNALRADVEFLANDLLQGRNTGSVGHEIAAHYVASRFAQYGVTPAGDNHGWFQTVPLLKSSLDKSSVQMVLHNLAGNSPVKLHYPEQFIMLASADSAMEKVRAQATFVGYGIVAKALKRDDYAGLNVAGKIVLILAGRPAAYQSEQGAYVAMLDEKIRHAAEHGAVGVIIMDTPSSESQHYYQHVAKFANAPRLQWQQKNNRAYGSYANLKSIALVTRATAGTIFTNAGLAISDIFSALAQDKIPSGFDLNLEISLTHNTSQERISSPNVVGLIEGSDPTLKQQYVLYSAHLDHLGVNANGVGDNINNGALDNAVGIAIMLDTARRFSLGEKPKRSILFVAVTGEEKNLLGSDYFAHNLPVPLNAIVADINLDMPILLYPFADIVAFGAQHSTMGDFVATAVAVNGLTLSPDPVPELALFVRTDHFSFVKQGIPSVYLMPGFTSSVPEINGGQVAGAFYHKHYHQPSDDLSLPIDYDAALLFTRVNFTLGKEIADSLVRPQWHPGDFFGDTFHAKVASR